MTGYPAIPLPTEPRAKHPPLKLFDPRDAGELAYLFNLILLDHIGKHGHTLEAVDACLGVLRGCTLGLEQRRADLIAERTR